MPATIIITGAAGHLGRAVVERLQGRVEHLSLTLAPGETDELLPPGAWEAETVDLTDEAAARSYVEEQAQRYTIDAAVLLVGGFAAGSFADCDAAALRRMYSLNFETAYFMARPLLEVFERQGHGRFVFISSRPAFRPEDGSDMVAYALSKGLVNHLAELINAAGDRHNIVATVIAPSTLDVPPNRRAMPAANPANWVPPARLAEAIDFLLSPAGRMLREPVLKMYHRG